jgi:hypothetical protein
VGLLYEARVNALIGEPECGKTWLALAAVGEVLHEGGSALFVDLEDAPLGIAERLQALGVEKPCWSGLSYSQPDSAEAVRARLIATVTDAPTLVVIDSMGALLSMLGVDSNSNDQVTSVFQKYLTPLARAGACVLLLDHVVKSRDARGRYPLGAQSKLSAISGTCLAVVAKPRFGRGASGRLSLTVTKDRQGYVRGRQPHGSPISVHVEVQDNRVALRTGQLVGPTSTEAFKPTTLMERVSNHLESQSNPESKRQILKSVGGKSGYVNQAIDLLIRDGYAVLDDSTPHPKVLFRKSYTADGAE